MVRKVFVSALCAVGLTGIPGGAAAQENVTLAIATTVLDVSQANVSSVPQFSGCWKNAGLNVTIQTTTGATAVQTLVTGQVQFAYLGPATALIARAKGAPVRAVYLNLRKNFQFPVVLESSPIKSVRDFKGKTMGVASYGTPALQIAKAMMVEAGLDPAKDITVIETGFGAQAVTALTSGNVDIWGTWDSQAATAENMGVKLRRFRSHATDKIRFGASFFVRDDFAEKNPQTVVKLLRCVAEASEMIIANPEGTIRAHWKVYPNIKPANLTEDVAFKQALHILKTRLEFMTLDPGEKWGSFPADAAKVLIDFTAANGATVSTLNPAEVATNQFIDQVNAFDREKVKAEAKKLQ